ncbi:hypothetical protein NNJEOMEG_00172 [Fundidesulfovibrio magnetotacticus]|uniref:Uncharacterized protein n=1 Tax=Fundidesulfovibrio magnetotacticus TaxID=2730080 RepID=A0A6V8LPS6_9BACT|nr:hypothetical protein [Fundidesulfovibrio magnetotacticus]GFK92348.1 hypothetical protein NNJEOMEG_00172 [Fundidesulfovibrio magnetotacticus]
MPARYATPKRWSTALARFLNLTNFEDFAASYLKDAKEQLCRVGKAIREMPEGPAPDQDFPEHLRVQKARA